MSIYHIKTLNTFTYSISYIIHIIVTNGFTITHSDNKTIICNNIDTLEISHDIIKKYLTNNSNYKSYNLHLRAYEENKDKESEVAKRKVLYNLSMITKIIQLYAIKKLFIELQENNLLTKTVVDK